MNEKQQTMGDPSIPPHGARDVPYAQRYAAAWAEISQRIAARQHVYLQFATVSVTATAAVLGAWAKSKETPWVASIADWGAFGLVIYAWAFAFWIRNNHALVGLLGVYCKALEGGFDEDPDSKSEYCDKDAKGRKPEYSWHTDAQGWIVVSRHYGRYSDASAVSLAFLASAPAGFFSFEHLTHGKIWPGAFLLAVAGGGIWAAVFLYRNRFVRDKIASYTPTRVREEAARLRPR